MGATTTYVGSFPIVKKTSAQRQVHISGVRGHLSRFELDTHSESSCSVRTAFRALIHVTEFDVHVAELWSTVQKRRCGQHVASVDVLVIVIVIA
jgi:hypothetical protein